jgi:hypothetical protein
VSTPTSEIATSAKEETGIFVTEEAETGEDVVLIIIEEEGDSVIIIDEIKSPVKDFRKWLTNQNWIRRWKATGKNVKMRISVRIPDSKFMCLET